MDNIFTKIIPVAEKDKKKEFHPGEHVVFKRIRFSIPEGGLPNEEFSLGGKIEVPEGYQIMAFKTETIETTERVFKSFDYICIDIWLINNKRVSVIPTFNTLLGRYDYSEPGTVVETLVEEPAPKLTFTPEKK